MDAFFTIAAPVPVEEPAVGVEDVLVDNDAIGTNGTHGSCVIA
ncbi:pheromone precursor [Trametes coccinea BRFM310]|uniref:Pheromone n=1 Tax=Trametes coccinea (strain BRFM310) TaxID=1353009 RepID=A0A1Y2IVB2_TRAC3|nr:pheromone precursor [Trametes coccinea BRFM310]